MTLMMEHGPNPYPAGTLAGGLWELGRRLRHVGRLILLEATPILDWMVTMSTRLDDYNERRKLAAKKKAAAKKNPHLKRSRKKPRLPLPLDAYQEKIADKYCRVCSAIPVEAHHIVDKKHFKHKDEMQHHPDNLMPLCAKCHDGHTSQLHPVPWRKLFPNEQAFVEHFRPQHRRQYA